MKNLEEYKPFQKGKNEITIKYFKIIFNFQLSIFN